MTKIKKETTVAAPVDIVYGAWHNFENLPRFMHNLEEVRVVSGGRSHWKAKGPLGISTEWDAEMTLDEPNKAIGWRSIRGTSLATAGRVNFAQVGSGTRVEVTIEYAAPAGPLGEIVAKIFANPDRQVESDLERFKMAIESGAEASGFTYGARGSASGATLGGSMGATTENDLKAIDRMNSGVSPQEIDDPAIRNERGGDFGEGTTTVPPVG